MKFLMYLAISCSVFCSAAWACKDNSACSDYVVKGQIDQVVCAAGPAGGRSFIKLSDVNIEGQGWMNGIELEILSSELCSQAIKDLGSCSGTLGKLQVDWGKQRAIKLIEKTQKPGMKVCT